MEWTTEQMLEMTEEQLVQIIVAQRADIAELRAEMAELREAWCEHVRRSVAGALEESAAHRRSLATGRCM